MKDSTFDWYRRLLGAAPKVCSLKTRWGDAESLPAYRRIRLSYQSEPGEFVPAALLVPHHVIGRRPAIVALHQHAHQFHWGKSEVLGLVGNPQQFYAHELALRGHIVLAPDAIGFEERVYPGMEGEPNLDRWTQVLLERGLSLIGKMASDVGRAVDLLQSLAFVDPSRIGVIGHSMGGWMTVFSMAAEPRLKVGVTNCGFSHAAPGAHRRLRSIDVDGKPVESLDRGRLVGELICPRPLMVISTTLDQDPEAVRADMEIAKRNYTAVGAEEKLQWLIPEGRHRFFDDVRPKAYEWLERWL